MLSYIKRFNHSVKEMDDLYRQAAKSSGLSESVFWILYLLRIQEKAVTQHELCAQLMLPKQTISTALKKMEADGWIEQHSDPQDRRQKLLCLSALGIQQAKHTADHVIRAENAAFSRFTASNAETMLDLLKRFSDSLSHELSRKGENP